jgi:hypothetical protein
MSAHDRSAWTAFDSETPVLTYVYAFGPSRVTSLAVGGAGGLFVMSPPYRAPQSVFDDLAKYGEVRALVATNGFHHMGIPEWKARFPNAAVFAPEQALARVRKKTGIATVEPVAEAAALAGPRLELVDMPHYRTGEVLARFETARGRAWYVTDIILNIRRMPRNPVVNLLYRMTASAPGLRWNQVGPRLIMVKDMRALKRWMREEFDRVTPRWLFTTHGETVDVVNERKEVRALFEG